MRKIRRSSVKTQEEGVPWAYKAPDKAGEVSIADAGEAWTYSLPDEQSRIPDMLLVPTSEFDKEPSNYGILKRLEPTRESKLKQLLITEFGASADQAEHVCQMAASFKGAANAPSAPIREYRPREGIIDYLRDPEGFGPWLEAGTLTRPLLREISPKAYTALANWLRNNELPADVSIPTKSETVATRPIDDAALRAAQRLSSMAQRTRRHQP